VGLFQIHVGITHWVTTTYFMGLLPIPRFRIYLGTRIDFLACSKISINNHANCFSQQAFAVKYSIMLYSLLFYQLMPWKEPEAERKSF